MKRAIAFLGLTLTLQGAAAAAGVTGRLDTLARGEYACELPGDAASRRGVPVPEEGFTIVNGSSYEAEGKTGTYLRVADTVTMTSGPKNGSRYSVKNRNFLRKLDTSGEPTGLRCVRVDANRG